MHTDYVALNPSETVSAVENQRAAMFGIFIFVVICGAVVFPSGPFVGSASVSVHVTPFRVARYRAHTNLTIDHYAIVNTADSPAPGVLAHRIRRRLRL
jgi:hypothetical protein